jgi:hypothetical protein
LTAWVAGVASGKSSVVSLTGTMTADDVLGAFASLTYRPRLLGDMPFNG